MPLELPCRLLDRLDVDRVDVLREPPDLVVELREPPDLVCDELRFVAGLLELRERLLLEPPAPLRLRLGDARFVPLAVEDFVRLLALFEPLLLRVELLLLVEPLLPLALFFRLLVLVVVVAIVSLLVISFASSTCVSRSPLDSSRSGSSKNCPWTVRSRNPTTCGRSCA